MPRERGHNLGIKLSAAENERLSAVALATGRRKQDVVREILRPVIHDGFSSPLQQARLWLIEERLKDARDERARAAQLLARYERAAASAPAWVARMFLAPGVTEMRAQLAAIDAKIQHLDSECERIRLAAPARYHAALALPLALTPNANLAATMAVVGIIAVAIYLVWRRRTQGTPRDHKAALNQLVQAVKDRREYDDPSEMKHMAREERPYYGPLDFHRRFRQSDDYLRLHLDDYLLRPNSLEALRQFAEDYSFEATSESGEPRKVRIAVFHESEFRNLPREVRALLVSGRTRDAISAVAAQHAPAPLVVTVAAASNGNGNGHHHEHAQPPSDPPTHTPPAPPTFPPPAPAPVVDEADVEYVPPPPQRKTRRKKADADAASLLKEDDE